MKAEIKSLIKEVTVGIILYNGLLAAIALIIYPSSKVFLGLAVGMSVALLMFIHMTVTFQQAMAQGDEMAAKRKTTVGVIFRSLIYILLLVVILWKVPQINILAVALGAMGLKAAAYSQPYIHRVMIREAVRKGD